MTPQRFGILDEKRQVDVKGATIHISPGPVGDCEIRLRGSRADQVVPIPGQVYVLAEPIVSPDRRRYRFSGNGIEIIWSMDGYSKCEMNVDFHKQQSLSEIENTATLMSWYDEGEIDLQVWARGARIVGATLSKGTAAPQFDWTTLLKVVKTLRSLAGVPHSDPVFSIAELNLSANKLYFMHQIIAARALAVEFAPIGELPENSKRVLYYISVDVGRRTVFALLDRPWRHDESAVENGRTRLIFGEPRICESWIASTVKSTAMIEDDYRRQLTVMINADEAALELGDIWNIYTGLKAEADHHS